MRARLAGLIAACLAGCAAAQSLEVRHPDIITSALPRSVEVGGTTYVDQGLVAAGSLPAATIDFLGDTLGSFSSLAIEPGTWKREGDTYSGVLWTLPDRGRNDPEHNLFFDYAGRVNRIRFSMTVSPRRSFGTVTLTPDGGIELKDFTGKPFTGAEPGAGTLTQRDVVLPAPATGIGVGKISLDAESLQFIPGGGFYIGDEYAANVYRFDAKGKLNGVLVPPNAVRPVDKDGKPYFTSLKPPATGRRNNQGVEGMALSPDGSRLFVMLQSALLQDSSGAEASGRALTRVLVYDVSRRNVPSKPVGHYVVQLPTYDDRGAGGAPNRTAAQSEIRVLDNHRFIMLSRDGSGWGAEGGKPIVFKSVVIVDTDGATNLAGSRYETGATPVIGRDGALRADIHTAAWKPLVNMLDPRDLARAGLALEPGHEGLAQLSEKWEAMDLLPALDPGHPDDWFLLVGNDNDFIAKHCVMEGQACDSPIDNDNRILVYRLTLPGMRSTTAPHH
ncbi:esterase-like activity of phytase family protein [Luteibacter aegosomatissinici]|uniref:esterase-like activity of phytase family protein n=1 Tax=Luteibacter aegosomatissinici TaxID=2911539 RepID=UPI001FFB6473|nr:esterase-like activity of phytase family protein [Luteibacter aegosomatissinici]UPG95125.1 esterase-like activity of phytase family protein [Luteibacter aegosomatissinici]